MANPSHLKCFFLRNVRVRKEHISGQAAPEDHTDLMRIVNKGETLSIQFAYARDLISSESALEDDQRGLNSKLIKEAKERFEEEAKEAKAKAIRDAIKAKKAEKELAAA